jgi:hypothetical protein
MRDSAEIAWWQAQFVSLHSSCGMNQSMTHIATITSHSINYDKMLIYTDLHSAYSFKHHLLLLMGFLGKKDKMWYSISLRYGA